MWQKLSLWSLAHAQNCGLKDKTININVEGVKMNQTDHSKAIGLNIDENQSWKVHIPRAHTRSFKKVASSIGALKRVRPFISMHTAIKYTKVLSNHMLITAVLFGMASLNN